MLHIHVGPTPNGRIPLLALEEMGLEYELHVVKIFEAAHYQPEYIAMNPASQIPVLIDDAPEGGGEPITVTQVAAILAYLAEASGELLPADPGTRARAREFVALHASDYAQAVYLWFHFERLLGPLTAETEPIRKALQERGRKYLRVMEEWIGDAPFLAGSEITIADTTLYPWLEMTDAVVFEELRKLGAWRKRMSDRDSVKKVSGIDLS